MSTDVSKVMAAADAKMEEAEEAMADPSDLKGMIIGMQKEYEYKSMVSMLKNKVELEGGLCSQLASELPNRPS